MVNRLRVVDMYPPPTSTGLAIDSTFTLEFNVDLDIDTINSVNVKIMEATTFSEVAVTFSYDDLYRRLTITPSALDPGTTYYVYVRGTETDVSSDPVEAGILGSNGEQLIGYIAYPFSTEASGLETPVITYPPNGMAISQDDTTPEEMFYWSTISVYANDSTTTVVDAGTLDADVYIINGATITISADVNSKSSYDNAVDIATAINSSDAGIIASANADGTLLLRHNTAGSANQIVIEDVGTYNAAHLDTIGTLMANPLAPPTNAYVVSTEDVLYEIQISEDRTFSNPVVSVDGISTPYYTPGSLLDSKQYFVRVKAYISTESSIWSTIGYFYVGIVDETDAGYTYVDNLETFKVESTSPENDSVNNFPNYITITFNRDVWVDSVGTTSVQVVGRSLIPDGEDVGELQGTVSVSDDTITWTPTITFSTIVDIVAPDVSWSATAYSVYRSTSKYGFYTPIATVSWVEGTTTDTTYTDSSATTGIIYWYRIEWSDDAGNRYPKTSPQQPRHTGFIDNQEYRVTISGSILSSDESTTASAYVSLGNDYIFYFTTRLYPLYASLQQLEIVLTPAKLEGRSTIELYSILLYNSLAAFTFNALDAIPSQEYSIQQFASISDVMGAYAKYYVCYVVNKSAYDILALQYREGWTGSNVTIGDFSYKDNIASRKSVDPMMQNLLDIATGCLTIFSNHITDDVFTWTKKANDYYHSPYYVGETRSWWSDKEAEPWRLRGY